MIKYSTKLFGLWLLLSCTAFLSATPKTAQSLERMLVELKSHAGDVLYPDTYQALLTEVNLFRSRHGDPTTSDAEAQWERLHRELTTWVELCRQAERYLTDVLDARERAVSLAAENLNSDVFQRAEIQLKVAAEHFRRQKSSNAAEKARLLYQKAEREAIRDHLLGEVRILLHESSEMGAAEYAPRLHQETRALLNEVESMLFGKRRPHWELSEKSRKLRQQARRLLFTVQLIQPLYQNKANAEVFLTNLLDQLRLLGEELNIGLNFEAGMEDLFAQFREAVENLKAENRFLAERNARLEEENWKLETNLLTYKSLSEQQQLLEQRIQWIKARFPGHAEERNGFLAVRVDSIAFAENQSLTPGSVRRLNEVLKTLRDFAHHPLIVRYLVVADREVVRHQQMATARAETIRNYVQAQPLFVRTPVQALGLVFRSSANDSVSQDGQLEILIDLAAYLTLHDPEAKPSD